MESNTMPKAKLFDPNFSYYNKNGAKITKKFTEGKAGTKIQIKNHKEPAVGVYEKGDLDPCQKIQSTQNIIWGTEFNDEAIPGFHNTFIDLGGSYDTVYWGKNHGNHVIKQDAQNQNAYDSIVLVGFKPNEINNYCTFLENGDEVMRIVDETTGKYLTINRQANQEKADKHKIDPNHLKYLKFQAETPRLDAKGKPTDVYSSTIDIAECPSYMTDDEASYLQGLSNAYYEVTCGATEL